MGKFALLYKQIEVRAQSRNELDLYAKVPLYYRKRLFRLVIDYAPGIFYHWIEEKKAIKSKALYKILLA